MEEALQYRRRGGRNVAAWETRETVIKQDGPHGGGTIVVRYFEGGEVYIKIYEHDSRPRYHWVVLDPANAEHLRQALREE